MFRTLGCLVVIYDICENIHRICANIGSYLACNICAAWPTVGSWRGNLLGKIGLEGAAYINIASVKENTTKEKFSFNLTFGHERSENIFKHRV